MGNMLQDGLRYYETGKHLRIMDKYSGWNPGHEIPREAIESIQAESLAVEREEKELSEESNEE